MIIYIGKTQSFMTCVWGYELHILKYSKYRNNKKLWYCITKKQSNLLYMLDKCKNWK